MFTITGFHKSTEQDNFDEGCIGGGSDYYFDYAMKDATLAGLKAKIANFHGCKPEELELDVCDEAGRIEWGKTENYEGYEASESELESWRKGETVLYYAVYTCYVMECKPVSAIA